MQFQPPIDPIDSKHNLWPIKIRGSRAKTWQTGESSQNETEEMLAPQTHADRAAMCIFDDHHTVIRGQFPR